MKFGLQDKLFLGNLSARRDWGFAGDYVEAMWMMLQQDHPDDFVIATGKAHSVQEFLDEAADYCGIDWTRHVEIDPKYFRPTEVDYLQGDASKAYKQLRWKPTVSFRELVHRMIDHDLELAAQENTLCVAGHRPIHRGVAHA
jgi:GDPmannose 4,6-dehydratase